MQSLPLRATQTLLLLSPLIAHAMPSAQRGEGGDKRAIVPRQDDRWKGDSNGNVHIRMSDNQVNFGTAQPQEILNGLWNACSTISCGSQGQDATIETETVNDMLRLQRSQLGGHASGTFASSSPGGRMDMLVLALAAMQSVEETEEKRWHDSYSCAVPEHCEWIVDGQDNDPVTEHWYPEEIHITIEDEDGGNRANLDLTFSVETSPHGDFCETLVDIGSGVSSAIGGLATTPGGPVFSLIGLACTAANS